MPVQFFARARLVPTPWKNGGGVTREIVRRPADAGLDGFDWRASIATLAADGPFSSFPGADRALVLLDGAGARLRSRDGELDHLLDTPVAPVTFAGETPIAATLLAGPSSDLNVMARRALLRIEMQTLRGACILEPCARGLLYAARGAWRILPGHPGFEPATLAADTGLWWDGEPAGWRLDPASAQAALVAVRLWPVAT